MEREMMISEGIWWLCLGLGGPQRIGFSPTSRGSRGYQKAGPAKQKRWLFLESTRLASKRTPVRAPPRTFRRKGNAFCIGQTSLLASLLLFWSTQSAPLERNPLDTQAFSTRTFRLWCSHVHHGSENEGLVLCTLTNDTRGPVGKQPH